MTADQLKRLAEALQATGAVGRVKVVSDTSICLCHVADHVLLDIEKDDIANAPATFALLDAMEKAEWLPSLQPELYRETGYSVHVIHRVSESMRQFHESTRAAAVVAAAIAVFGGEGE